jgi:hypothetical protein
MNSNCLLNCSTTKHLFITFIGDKVLVKPLTEEANNWFDQKSNCSQVKEGIFFSMNRMYFTAIMDYFINDMEINND